MVGSMEVVARYDAGRKLQQSSLLSLRNKVSLSGFTASFLLNPLYLESLTNAVSPPRATSMGVAKRILR